MITGSPCEAHPNFASQNFCYQLCPIDFWVWRIKMPKKYDVKIDDRFKNYVSKTQGDKLFT